MPRERPFCLSIDAKNSILNTCINALNEEQFSTVNAVFDINTEIGSIQGHLIQGKARLALKNWKNLFGDQREDSLTSLEVCYLLQ